MHQRSAGFPLDCPAKQLHYIHIYKIMCRSNLYNYTQWFKFPVTPSLFKLLLTAATPKATLDSILQMWDIDKTRVHVVLPCMAHTLQLVVNDGLLSRLILSDTVATGRYIV